MNTQVLQAQPKTSVSQQTHCIGVDNNLAALLYPQVRVFTYLIGREMTFADNVKWIACNNKGKTNKGG